MPTRHLIRAAAECMDIKASSYSLCGDVSVSPKLSIAKVISPKVSRIGAGRRRGPPGVCVTRLRRRRVVVGRVSRLVGRIGQRFVHTLIDVGERTAAKSPTNDERRRTWRVPSKPVSTVDTPSPIRRRPCIEDIDNWGNGDWALAAFLVVSAAYAQASNAKTSVVVARDRPGRRRAASTNDKPPPRRPRAAFLISNNWLRLAV